MSNALSIVTVKVKCARESAAWNSWPGIPAALAKHLDEYDAREEDPNVGFWRGIAGRPGAGRPSGCRPHGWVELVVETAQLSPMLEDAQRWCEEHPFICEVSWEVSRW